MGNGLGQNVRNDHAIISGLYKTCSFYMFFTAVSLLLASSGCQTVTTKIDETTELEKKELSQWLNKTESDLKIFYGQPKRGYFATTIS